MENLSISKYIFESPRLGFRTSNPKVLLNGMNQEEDNKEIYKISIIYQGKEFEII